MYHVQNPSGMNSWEGQGFYNSWTLAAGGSKPTAVQSNAGATSDIRADTALSDSYILQDLPAEAASIVGNVVHNATLIAAFNNGGLTCAHQFRYSGANLSGGSSSLTASYVTYTKNFANAPDGSPWTPAILNATEIMITSGGTNRVKCTYLQATGTYDTAAPGFMALIFRIAGLIGAGIVLEDMPKIAKAASLVSPPGICRSLILPREYGRALDAWQAYKHPRVFLLGRG